jgi:F-type H+-transporting ATPase subunit b
MRGIKNIRARCRGALSAAGLVWSIASLGHPPVVWASEEGGKWGIWETVGRFFNLGLVVAVLVYALRKPMGQFLEERRQNIRKSLQEAEQARIAAEAKLAEMETRMSALDAEMDGIRQKAAQDADEERRRSTAQAEEEAERIVAVARREADSLVRSAGLELRQEAARLAVQLAEGKIRAQLGTEEDSRLIDHFAGQLNKTK